MREPNDIASYAALACIAIQSNQNDQHGGQSIPNFDYGLAPGVIKTYKKRYALNYERVAEILCPEAGITEKGMRALIQKIQEEQGVYPNLDENPEYLAAEKAALAGQVDEATIEKLQKFACHHAKEETERATYQAMEGLVHNLNTMHSRAGAQTPFSSINYGTDTSAEGRLVMRSVMLATEAGLGRGETPIFPIHIFRVKEGINYNPEDPNYDLFSWPAGFRQSGCSRTSHSSTRPSTCNTISPAIPRRRFATWAAAPG